MTALNKQALRQLAEKATPGPWEMEHENIWFRDTEGYTKHLMYAYQGDDVDDQQDYDNTAYIAAFNPKVVLALLDELEAAEKRIAEQREILAAAEKLVRCKGRYHSEINYRALAKLFGVTTPDLPPLEHENVHYADAAEMEIAALRQRIVELEARKVCVPRISNDEFWLSFNNRIVFREETYRSAVIKSIEAAGIGVKGE